MVMRIMGYVITRVASSRGGAQRHGVGSRQSIASRSRALNGRSTNDGRPASDSAFVISISAAGRLAHPTALAGCQGK